LYSDAHPRLASLDEEAEHLLVHQALELVGAFGVGETDAQPVAAAPGGGFGIEEVRQPLDVDEEGAGVDLVMAGLEGAGDDALGGHRAPALGFQGQHLRHLAEGEVAAGQEMEPDEHGSRGVSAELAAQARVRLVEEPLAELEREELRRLLGRKRRPALGREQRRGLRVGAVGEDLPVAGVAAGSDGRRQLRGPQEEAAEVGGVELLRRVDAAQDARLESAAAVEPQGLDEGRDRAHLRQLQEPLLDGLGVAEAQARPHGDDDVGVARASDLLELLDVAFHEAQDDHEHLDPKGHRDDRQQRGDAPANVAAADEDLVHGAQSAKSRLRPARARL
jgi:hypothetical protein